MRHLLFGCFVLQMMGFSAGKCPDVCVCEGGKVTCDKATEWPQEPGIDGVYRLTMQCAETFTIPQLTKAHFDNYTGLTYLSIQDCSIKDIADDTFEVLKQIGILQLSRNQLTTIHQHTFSELSQMTHLYLDDNNIESIPDNAFIHLHKIKNIRLNNNSITSIGKHAFEDLDHMTNLYLENNPSLTFVDPKAFLYSKIDYIAVSDAGLDEGFVNAIAPLYNCTDCRGIYRLKWVRNSKPLTFTANTFKGLSLTSLDLSDNQLTDHVFLNNVLSVQILLNGNNFTSLDFSDYTLTKTTYFSITKNKVPLTLLDFNTWSRLSVRYIYLDDSNIGQLSGSLSPLGSLEWLSISKNKIKYLPEFFVRNNSRLSTLNIQENLIRELNATMFPPGNASILRYFRAYGNNIQTVPKDMEDCLKPIVSNMKGYFLIYDNPLVCNCELKWLRNLLFQRDSVLDDPNDIKQSTNCSSPDNVNLKTLDPIDMTCTLPSISQINRPIGNENWKCDVRGNPAPTVQWEDAKGNILAVKEPINIAEPVVTLSLTQNEALTDPLTCVAYNSQGRSTSRIYFSSISKAQNHHFNVLVILALLTSYLICTRMSLCNSL